MHHAHCPDADHVGEPVASAGLLPDAGLAAELPGDLDDLTGTGGAERMERDRFVHDPWALAEPAVEEFLRFDRLRSSSPAPSSNRPS